MSKTSKDLFAPLKMGSHTLKNRIGLAPMTRMSSEKDGIPRQDVLDFLVRRAENDVALITTEAIVSDYESAQGYPGQARLTTQRQIDAWAQVNAKIRAAGSVSVLQIFHCGRIAWNAVNPAERTIAPSALIPKQNNPLTSAPYPVPDVMSSFDIAHVIQGFVETVKGGIAAGFDGIEIHGAHGYLINAFLSSYSNQRADNYGGSVENRFRFMEVSLFADADEWTEVIRFLDRLPIDAISVSTYRFGDEAFGTGKNMAQLTRSATRKPLLICGGIHDLDTAEAALADADMILSGKSLLLNPYWVNDLRANKPMDAYSSEQANIAYTKEPLP
ncbi:MAG: NADH-dependent flavin oxidoreductase [Acidithiobacillus ferrivorans]|uniref:NADH-dependent flavin oxidoreductase n=1 Tax=Acidithiobacillus ferrivorans TaxID=160808 RepID=A0A257T636_9PROT|nr:MAG: NADH-dependent flavin oxidoreductase [Acidithiobacillus ferrivorans]